MALEIALTWEVLGIEGDNFVMHDVFAFKQTGVDANQVAQGYFHTTGVRPNCLERLASLRRRRISVVLPQRARVRNLRISPSWEIGFPGLTVRTR